jgi:hypothetical protein
VEHSDCRDALLQRRYRYEHVRLVRIKALVDMLRPLVEALGLADLLE